MYSLEAYDAQTLGKLAAEIPLLLEATAKPEVYDPEPVEAGLKRLQAALGPA